MAASVSRNRRLLKLGLGATAVATAGGVSVFLKDSPWWSSLAPVRFGRAAIAVSQPSGYYALRYGVVSPAAGAYNQCRLQMESQKHPVRDAGVPIHHERGLIAPIGCCVFLIAVLQG